MTSGSNYSDELEVKDFKETTGDRMTQSMIYASATYVANGGIGLVIVGGLVRKFFNYRIIYLQYLKFI